MAASAPAMDPIVSFEALARVEPSLRARYLQLESPSTGVVEIDDRPETLVTASAHYLEILLVGSAMQEALAERDCSLTEATPAILAEINDQTAMLLHLDPIAVVGQARQYFKREMSGDRAPELSLPAVVRAVKSLLELCPIHHLEKIATSHKMELWGHRCRIAYDGLKAFVLRNDAGQKERLSVLGHAYARGAFSIDDVATLLAVHPVDAVALLESHGFSRRLEQIRLDTATREHMFSEMRVDRLRRDGAAEWTQEAVARDVVASERLEGVDARSWIRRDV